MWVTERTAAPVAQNRLIVKNKFDMKLEFER